MPPTVSMPPPRTDRTAEVAIARVTRAERPAGLWVSIQGLCGDQLIEAFRRVGLAYYQSK